MRVDFPPYAFINEYGRPDGFSVELLNEAASLMGLTLDIRMGPVGKLKESLLNGEVDMVLGLEHTEEITGRVVFGQPHTIIYDAIFFSKSGGGFEEIEDLSRRRVVVIENDIAHRYLSSHGITENIRTVETVGEGLKAVAGGKAEAALVPLESAEIILNNYNISGLTHSDYPITAYHRTLAFAASEQATEKLSIVEQGMSLMRTNGAYDRVFSRWFDNTGHMTAGSARVIRYALFAGLILTALLSGILTWAMYLRRKNAVRTRLLAREINARETALEELKIYRNRTEELIEERTTLLRDKLSRLDGELSMLKERNDELDRERSALSRSLEISGCGYWQYSIDRGTVTWDERIYAMFDINEDEYSLSLQKFVDLFSTPDARRFGKAMDSAAEQGIPFELEIWANHAEAGEACFLVRGKPMQDQAGRIFRVDGTILNITERKDIEREWQEAYADLHELFSAYDDPFMVIDSEFTVLHFNSAAGNLFGVEKNAVLGRSLFEKVFPDLKKTPFEKNVSTVIIEKSVIRFETYFDLDFLNGWFDVKVFPYRDGAAISLCDNTERKEAETRIAASEKRFHEMTAASPDPIMIVSALDERVVYSNRRFGEIFGYSPESKTEYSLRNMNIWISDTLREEFYSRLAKSGNISNFETEIKNGKNQTIPCLISSGQVMLDNLKHYIISIKTIEERKKQELALGRQNRLLRTIERINRVIHEMNDPGALTEKAVRMLIDELHYSEGRILLADRKLKPVLIHDINNAGKSVLTKPDPENSEFPRCCKHLFFTNEVGYIVNKITDCTGCAFVSIPCPENTFVIALKHNDRIKGFMQLSHSVFEDDEIDDLCGLGSNLAGVLDRLETETLIQKDLQDRNNCLATLISLARLFTGCDADNLGEKLGEGLGILAEYLGARLGIIVTPDDAGRPELIGEWHNNGFRIDEKSLEQISFGCMGKGEENNSITDELEKIICEKSGLYASTVYSFQTGGDRPALILLASEKRDNIEGDNYREILESAAAIFGSVLDRIRNTRTAACVRREIEKLLDQVTGISGGEVREQKFSLDEDYTQVKDTLDNENAGPVDINFITDQILSDSYYRLRDRRIGLTRTMGIPPVKYCDGALHRLLRGLIDSIIENISDLKIEIGFDHYAISPRGEIGGYYFHFVGGVFSSGLEDRIDEANRSANVEIWSVDDGALLRKLFIGIPAVESHSLVVSENRALVQV